MASNGYGNPGNNVLVLYKVVNSESDRDDPSFNAFPIARGGGPTLKAVKQNCEALRHLNHLGAEGFHWRVCVEDKPAPGAPPDDRTFSWWDIQDENARLPVKEASQSELAKFFAPPKPSSSSSGGDSAAQAAKGAFKSLGKAVNSVVGTDSMTDYGPPVSVIAFKLLDVVKMHDDFATKHGGGKGVPAPPPAVSQPRPPAPRHHQPARPAAPPQRRQAPPPQQAPNARAQTHPPQRQQPQDASLLDFGGEAASAGSRPQLYHTTSSPAAFDKFSQQSAPPPPANESRAERLKREYAQKEQKANRVWDDVDQRWVEVDPKGGLAATTTSQSAPPGVVHTDSPPKKKEIGITLDPANAAGKAAHVQAAVHKRVSEMQGAQQKALAEIREREMKKKNEEAEEDIVRQKLEPRIKEWSEEHGKKKQLRALLASLHTILWPEAEWKPVGLGDLLDDSKCKRWFHKASRVVHPDKTHHLDAEKRFLSKRIFDALSQAKSEYDNGSK